MLPGERVAGRFEIIGEAGRGGMGTVFRARDRKDKREVALKVLAASAVRNIARFEQECAILSGVRHPNIVEYVTHGATPDGIRYLVMEWVEGETLYQRLERYGVDSHDTVVMATQLARALGALHAHGVVHRDLKPSNIMLIGGALGGGIADVKLVDLGVARRTTEPGRLTRTGALVGTAGYMAPEQVRGGKQPIDGRADLFALGCVMFECLTGQQAFVGESPLAARAKVLVHDPPPVRAYEPGLPEPLEALVSSLLARNVDARPASAAVVEQALVALGEVGSGRPPRRAFDVGGTRTEVSTPETRTQVYLCAVIVSWRTDDESADDAYRDAVGEVAGATVEQIEGGLVVLFASPVGDAARVGLDLMAKFPRALVAIAVGESADRAIDQGARLVQDIEIDTVAAPDDEVAGVWLDRATAGQLGEGFRVVPTGDRVRVIGRM